jgi:hypothetical protein
MGDQLVAGTLPTHGNIHRKKAGVVLCLGRDSKSVLLRMKAFRASVRKVTVIGYMFTFVLYKFS